MYPLWQVIGVVKFTSPSRYRLDDVIQKSLYKLCGKSDIKILDVGCGAMEYADMIDAVMPGNVYLGIDIIEPNNKAHPFMLYDAENLNEMVIKYDLILSIQALEHIRDDVKALKGMAHCLKNDGVMLISLPSKYSFFLYLWHGYRRYSRMDITLFAHENNLEIKELLPAGGLMSFILHIILWSIPAFILNIKIWDYYKRHALIMKTITRLEKLSLSVDRIFSLLPGSYVVILTKKGSAPQR